jgi:glycosyltransferase involved in cell wall biosynthesis
VGAIPETISSGEEGIVVESGAAWDLSGAILNLMDDPVRRRGMGEAARKRAVALFSPEKILEELESIYGELLDR